MGVQAINFASFKVAAGGGGGGITFIGASGVVGSGFNLTPTLPAHQAGDILIVAAQNAGPSVMSVTGWTEIGSASNGVLRYTYWWKRAASSSETNPTVSAGSSDQYARAYVFRGCVASGTPYENATVTSIGPTTTPTSSGITTTGANRLAVVFEQHYGTATYSSGLPPSGWTADSSTVSGSGFAVISKVVAAPATEPSVTVATLSANSWHGTCSLALIPV